MHDLLKYFLPHVAADFGDIFPWSKTLDSRNTKQRNNFTQHNTFS